MFLYAGAVKLDDVRALAVDVANYRLLPDWAVPAFAAALPGVEVVCGLGLLLGGWVRAAAWLSALMMIAFSIATGQALVRGINLDCGCFGAGRAPVTMMTLYRDLALLVAALATAFFSPADRPASVPPAPPSHGSSLP